jgi:hypothetical protein
VAQTDQSIREELARRHRTAVIAVWATAGLTLLLVALALAGVFMRRAASFDPLVLRIVIVFLVVGAIVFRRTKFSAARLQDIASVRGVSALLATLQNTTMLLALIGGAIAIMGFLITMRSGDGKDMIVIGLISIVVLFYAYPRRAAWQRVVDSTQTTDAIPSPSAKGTIA